MPESSLTIRIDGADADRSAKALTRSLNGLTKAGDKTEKEFEQVNEEAKKTGRVFGGLKKSVLGVKAAIAGIGLGAISGAILANTQRQQAAIAGIESRIRSTGQAAGFTTDQIRDLAAGFQQATSVGDEAILEFQQVLLTFTGITGDAFTGATEAVLNISEVMGTDLRSAAVQVGKALNDPVKGVNSLSRAGVQFSEQQKEIIKDLVETGESAKAQQIILEELEVQFGGAASAAKNTFAGSLRSVQNAFGDLLEAEGGLDDATDALLDLEKLLSSPEVKQAANDLTSGLIRGFSEAVKFITDLTQKGRELGNILSDLFVTTREERLQEQLQEVNNQISQLDEEAREGKISIDEYKDEIAGLTSELFTLEEQLEDARKEVEKPLTQEVEQDVRQAFEPTKDKLIDQLVAPEEETKVQGLIKALKQQSETIGLTNKELQIYKLRLEGASEAEIQQATIILDNIAAKERDIEITKQQEEADELAIEAIEKENEAIEEQSRLLSEYAASVDPVLAVEKQRTEEMEKLNALLDAGVISQSAYNNRLDELEEAARDAALATGQLTKEQQAFEGAKAALEEYAETATDTFTQVKDVVSNAFKEGEDALVNFAKTGKLEIKDLVDSILDDLLRLSIKEGVGQLSGAFAGALGGGGTSGGTGGSAATDSGGGFGSFIQPLLGGIGSIFGLQRGGSFKIPNGGVDNQLVLLRARAGEEVDVNTPAQQNTNSTSNVTRNFFYDININGATDFNSFQENADQVRNELSQGLQESERNL